MANIIIYQKPTCTTCRQVYSMLKESGVDFSSVNYYIDPIPKKKLKELIKKLDVPPMELLRKKEPLYKELGLDKKELTVDELVDALVEYPDLLQRPIVEKGSKAILARPAEKIKKIL